MGAVRVIVAAAAATVLLASASPAGIAKGPPPATNLQRVVRGLAAWARLARSLS